LLVAGVAGAEEPEPTPLPEVMFAPFYRFDPNTPTIDRCYEYLYSYALPCPEGYGRVVVNTPSSDRKHKCKESFGAIIECGRVAEETDD